MVGTTAMGNEEFEFGDGIEQLIRHVRLAEVVKLVSCSDRTWLRWVKLGRAPGAVRLGPGVVAWRLKDVRAWLDSRPAAGGAA